MEEDPNSTLEDEPTADESIFTLDEVLQYEDQMMEDTAAVLGAMNDKNCSYAEGYVKRQALYSCLTCIPDSKTDVEKRAGVCLACSYHCHDGHELIELYTKRNFRCDCGNSKFGENGNCNLLNEKEPLNEENVYNQNFQGKYCVCSRPYPDPEDSITDDMIQCIICEDWYHSRHLNAVLPDAFVEMICFSCVGDHPFLLHYAGSSLTKVDEQVESSSSNTDEVLDVNQENITESNEEKSEESQDETPQLENSETINDSEPIVSDCKKPKTMVGISTTLFWPDILWRNSLCTCDVCLEMYGDENVLFLIDGDDPVQVYEQKGKAKSQEVIDDQGKNFLGSMDRVQLIETIAGYNDFKANLAEFFKGFAEKKKVIREEDVKEFFEEMRAKKRRRTEISHFCR